MYVHIVICLISGFFRHQTIKFSNKIKVNMVAVLPCVIHISISILYILQHFKTFLLVFIIRNFIFYLMNNILSLVTMCIKNNQGNIMQGIKLMVCFDMLISSLHFFIVFKLHKLYIPNISCYIFKVNHIRIIICICFAFISIILFEYL